MKPCFKFFSFLIAINFSIISCQQKISLIGSRLLSSDSKYKAYLVTHGLDEGSNISVGFGPKNAENEVLNDAEQSSFREFSFDVPEKVTNYELEISSKIKNSCKEQSVDIINIEESPMVFIQFNKPIYKTNEIFKFRVFILSRNLLPIANYGPIDVEIRDSRNAAVSKYETNVQTNKYGVYEDAIKIWEIQHLGRKELGVWTIEVKVNDRKVSKTFEVQNSNEGTEVFVEAQSIVAFADRKTYLNIYTKDPYGRYAEIFVKANFVNSSREEINKFVKRIELTDSKTSVGLDFQDDLDIKYPTFDMNLSFTVQITGSNPTTVMKNMILKHKGRNTIQVIRKKYFKPGYKFSVKVRVKILDGKPDNSLNQLKTTIKYISSEVDEQTNQPKIEEKNFQTNLKNGETIHTLYPKANTEKIDVLFEFADTELLEEIEKFPGVNEYMQVTMLNKSSTIGSSVQIKVQSTEEMEQPYMLIFGTKGIIRSEKIENAVGKDVFDFPLELTDEMRPEARGLVFYTRNSDGAIIYDEFSFSIGFSINNSLEISTPEKAEPNKTVDITVKTEEDSQVFLIPIDVNSALFTHENEISRTSIYNELVYHINKKYEGTSDYHFEKLNAFILEPLKNGKTCSGLSSRFGGGDDEDLQPKSEIDKTPHKYFPEALDEIIYVATSSENETIQMKFPDRTTTWKIYGISVHPEKGFTVAKTQPEIAIKAVEKKEKLKIEISGPTTINQGEVHMLYIIATNEMKTNLTARLSVTIQDGSLIKEVASRNQICRKHKESSLEEFIIQFTPENHVVYKKLQVSSNKAKPIKIMAIITAGKARDEKFKNIEVLKNMKNLVNQSLGTELIDINNSNLRFEMDLVTKDASTKTFAAIYGNLLGPAVDGLETILSRKMVLDEDKALKFGTEVVIYEFLKNSRLETTAKARTVLINVKNYYQEIRQTLQDIINKRDPKKVWLAALITDIIMDASTIIQVDDSQIENSLALIKDYYIPNQSKFPYDSNSDIRRDISSKNREKIQTALIAKTILRSRVQETKNLFFHTLNNLYNNRKSFEGDHIKAVVAYVLAYQKQYQKSKDVLADLQRGYSKKNTYPKHFTMYVEVISYEILTKVLLNQDAREQVIALLKHRNAEGAFYSPYDTYLALKALSEYSRYRKIDPSNFGFHLDENFFSIGQLESKTVNVNKRKQKITVGHKELGYVNVYNELIDQPTAKNESFNLKEIGVSKVGQNDLNIYTKFSYVYRDGSQSNLVALEIDLPEGYEYSTNLGSTDMLVEIPNHDQKVILYLNKVEKGAEFWQSIRIKEKPSSTKFHKPLYIKIYDYYRPNLKNVYSYDLLCV